MFRYRGKYIGIDGTTVADLRRTTNYGWENECFTVDRKNIDIEGVC